MANDFAVSDLGNGKWAIDVCGILPSGKSYRKRRRIRASSRRMALEFARKIWQQAVDENVGNKRATPILSEFAERWIREHAMANQQKASGIEHKRVMLRAHILPVCGSKRLDQIDVTDVSKIKSNLSNKAPKTVNNALIVLASLLRTAQRWKILQDTPEVRLLKVPKRPAEFLKVGEYAALVEAARTQSVEALVIVLLAGDAGLRLGEILALEWDNIDFVARRISVTKSRVDGVTGHTKGMSVRHVGITSDLLGALIAARSSNGTETVLPKTHTKKTVHGIMSILSTKAGLQTGCRIHILRHTFASHAVMSGVSLYAVQKALGHTDHATTQGYAHLSADSISSIANSIDAGRQKKLP